MTTSTPPNTPCLPNSLLSPTHFLPSPAPSIARDPKPKLQVKEDPDRRGVVWTIVFVSLFTGMALGDFGVSWFTLGIAVALGAAWSSLVVYILEEAFPIQW
ncbi:hypothetical protein T439DRAFT_359239 [Meredithblackwellia eburnea MCA 4105]